MTGDLANTALANPPKSQVGTKIQIVEGNNVKVIGQSALADAGYWKVDSDVSYDIAEFPVVLCITKNLCSCKMEDGCNAFESANVYVCTGDNVTPSPNCHVKGVDIGYDAYDINGDNYLYFFYDTSLDNGKFTGRINGTRFDFGIDMDNPGANEFEIVLQAFFRTTEEAEAYAEEVFKGLGWTDDPVTPPVGGDTEPVDPTDSTEEPVEDTKEETTKPVQNENEGGEQTSGGCASTIGFGAIAVVAVVAATGFVAFKKKD
jgi:hypothetical protein